ncbi:MAG TPA: hypothetical protein VLL25_02740, partial [Acidimicrobiales bacterium]|nr:hypothetical protein [Acidimicrobiales bacterium]
MSHLGADGTAAQDEQATGERLGRRDIPVVPRFEIAQAFYGWDGCARAGSDNDRPPGGQVSNRTIRAFHLDGEFTGNAPATSDQNDPVVLQPSKLPAVA